MRAEASSTVSTAAAVFKTTHWSVVLAAGKRTSEAALERLCRTYWYPLYVYARRRGQNAEDAQDLTQQFFAGFLQKNYFSLATPERGRFRCFLLGSFKHFLANEYKRSKTAKRGGGYEFVSWDEAEAHYRKEPGSDASPDKLFEKSWALTVLEKVMRDLHQEYVRAGKGRVLEMIEVFLSGEKSESTYAEIGEQLQMSESAVKMAVLRLRRRYGELLRAEIAQTVTSPADLADELRYLISTMGR